MIDRMPDDGPNSTPDRPAWVSAAADDDPAAAQAATRALLGGGLAGRRVLVVGDVMLDRYLWGSVQRISPEAPVPVVRLARRTEHAGGAGNVARNLAGLGLRADLLGWVGDDDDGRALRASLDRDGIDADGLLVADGRPTITKTRIIGEHQQMLRLDAEDPSPLPAGLDERLLDAALARLDRGCDAVILSDYAKGALAPGPCRAIVAEGRRRGLPVLVDPKGADFAKYRGATAITPNRPEWSLASGVPADNLDALLAAARESVGRLGLDFLALTLGELGISLVGPGVVRHLPTRAREVFDVSGAGDTVIATLAAGLLAGLDPAGAVELANLAAGVVVGKLGTVPIELDELARAAAAGLEPLACPKVYAPADLRRLADTWRGRGQRLVFTNGCFDVLHAGHVVYLERARALGDRLIVGLNDDDSIRRLKGPTRPVNRLEDRARLLGGLTCVDAIVPFADDTPLDLILALRPDVLAKGADYTEDRIVGAPEVRSWGGDVAILPLLAGRSTTATLERLNRP